MKRLVSVLFFFSLLSVSLGVVSPSLALSNPSLIGVWVQPCQGKSRKSEIVEQVDEGLRAKLTETSFRREGCASPQVSWVSSGPIGLPGSVATHEGAQAIDFTFGKVEMIFHTEEAARYANQTLLCGKSDWQRDVAQEVSALECDLFGTGQPIRVPSPGERRFGIYRMESAGAGEGEGARDRLYFGRLTLTEDARSEKNRPTTLDPRFFERQMDD